MGERDDTAKRNSVPRCSACADQICGHDGLAMAGGKRVQSPQRQRNPQGQDVKCDRELLLLYQADQNFLGRLLGQFRDDLFGGLHNHILTLARW